MITNHTPKSTLLMMVSAFCGHDLMKRAYEEAIKKSINSILMVMPC
jgi:S-adenosylmethionine:tRNA ribosyltransferase-isomerase